MKWSQKELDILKTNYHLHKKYLMTLLPNRTWISINIKVSRLGLNRIQHRRKGTAEERFWKQVNKTNKCWTWIGARDGKGYGQFYHEGKNHRAHRWLYQKQRGITDDSKVIDHLCRNKICVNPDHLELVTQAENLSRGYSPSAINNRKTRCIRGHNIADNNNIYIDSRGHRVCKTCHKTRRQK